MTAPGSGWMCKQCKRAPVSALGEELCAECVKPPEDIAEDATEDETESEAEELLDASVAALQHDDPMTAIALVLQGILALELERTKTGGGFDVMPSFVLPEALTEPEPPIGPKAWGAP